MYRRFPTPEAWRRHTRGAARRGLSAAALACLGIQPRARVDPASFTGYTGTVRCATRDEAVCAGILAAQAVGPGRGVRATRLPAGWQVTAPISKQAARELMPPKRIPNTPSEGPARTPAYDMIMRPTARARLRAESILAES